MAARHGRPHALLPHREPYASASESTAPHVLRERITEEFAELDAREKEIVHRRLELKRLWNSTLLICKLPNELLVHIFVDFQDDSRTSDGDREQSQRRRRRHMGWPGLMLVCRQWREILVSTPTFWRRIELGLADDWMKLCLSRSTNSSIDIVGLRDFSDSSDFDMLSLHAYRFRSFSLEIEYLSASLWALFLSEKPILEELRFSLCVAIPSDIDFELTSQRFPRLRTLELASAVAPRDASLFAQLRALSLSCCPHHLSFDAFLNALAACIQLEELVLNATLNHLSGDEWMQITPVPWRPPISLPRLRSLTLLGHTPVHTSRFLAHMHVEPSTVFLRLSALLPSRRHLAPTTIRAMLPPTPPATLAVLGAVRQAVLTVGRMTYLIQAGGLAAGDGKCPPQASLLLSPAPDARNIVLMPVWDSYMSQGLDDLTAALAHAPLTHLVVRGVHRHGTPAAWAGVFRTFALLEELNISGEPVSDVECVFRGLHAASAAHAGRDRLVVCPALKRVLLEGVGTVGTYEAVRTCFLDRGERGVFLSFLNLALSDDPEDLVLEEARDACIADLGKAVGCIRIGDEADDDGRRSHDV